MASMIAGICRNGSRLLHRIPSNIPLVQRNIGVAQCCAYSSTSKKAEQSEFVIGKRTEPDPQRVEELRKEDFRDPRRNIRSHRSDNRHSDAMVKLCHICGQRCLKHPCAKHHVGINKIYHAERLHETFGVDVTEDVEGQHPLHLCKCCVAELSIKRPSSREQYENKGYHQEPIADAYASKVVLVSTLSITFVGICFIVKYMSDYRQRKWARREAERLIALRTEAGEPLVNPDFIPMDKLIVPTDEEMEAIWAK